MSDLESVPVAQRWAVADSALIQAITTGSSVVRGRRGARLRQLIEIASKLSMLPAVVTAFGITQAVWLFCRQGVRTKKSFRGPLPNHWFVGIGAGQEEHLFALYANRAAVPVGRVDQRDVRTLASWKRVGLLELLSEMMRSIKAARLAIGSMPDNLKQYRSDFWFFVALRIAWYSYYVGWFRKLKQHASGQPEVCFLACDTAAFAAGDVGLRTRLMQHGLIRKSLLLPQFSEVDALTYDEALYFRARLPAAQVHLDEPLETINADYRSGVVLVASIYASAEQMSQITGFLDFARENGLHVIVRPHPREDLDNWQAVSNGDSYEINDPAEPFESAVKRIRPAFVVSWFSTALADVTKLGVIPVTVCKDGDRDVADLVYPLWRRCLRWPADRETLMRCNADRAIYATTLSELTSRHE